MTTAVIMMGLVHMTGILCLYDSPYKQSAEAGWKRGNPDCDICPVLLHKYPL
jgi:hypothetical protein